MADDFHNADDYPIDEKEMEFKLMKQQRVKRFQIINFSLLFLLYGSAHACRSGWSEATSTWGTVEGTDELSKNQGFINMTFLLMYSLGLSAGGPLGERLRLHRYLGIGMILASSSIILMSIISNFNTDKHINFMVAMTYVFMGLNGLFQSVGMPGCVSTLGNWFSTAQRGAIVGLWAGCQNFGDILGFILGEELIGKDNPWKWGSVMIVFSSLLLVAAITNLYLLYPYPEEVDVYEQDIEIEDARQRSMSLVQNVKEQMTNQTQEKLQNLNFFTAFLIPGVPIYVVIFCCIQSVNYGLLFWLPTYLKHQGGDESSLAKQSGYIASMMDVGAFIGGSVIGQLSDKAQKRAIFMLPMMALSCGFMCIINYVLTTNATPYYFVILAIGLTFGGCYNIVGSTVTLDLAKQPALSNNPEAKGTVNSVINGAAAFCAAIFQQLLKLMQDEAFFAFMVTAAICTIVMIPLFYKDIVDMNADKSAERESLLEHSESQASQDIMKLQLKSIEGK